MDWWIFYNAKMHRCTNSNVLSPNHFLHSSPWNFCVNKTQENSIRYSQKFLGEIYFWTNFVIHVFLCTSLTPVVSCAFCYTKTGNSELLSVFMSSSWVFVQSSWNLHQNKYYFLRIHFDILVLRFPAIYSYICMYKVPTLVIGRYQETNILLWASLWVHISFLLRKYHMIDFLINN